MSQDQRETLTFYPFAYALLDDCLNDFCWYCLAEQSSDDQQQDSVDGQQQPEPRRIALLRCTGCKTAYFCSKDCLTKGWSDHKAECKAFGGKRPPSIYGVPDVEVRMLGRLAWRHKQIVDGLDKKAKDFYTNRTSQRAVMDLCSHDGDMRNDEKATTKFESILLRLKQFYDRKFLPDDDETIFQLHCRNFINRHGISDRKYLREIGKGLYLDLCWYDHSCRPNSLYTHNGFVAILRSLSTAVNLSDRSSTFYTYIDLLQSNAERRRALLDSWYFDCRCSRCVDESDHALTSMQCEGCRSPVAIFEGTRLKPPNDLQCDNCGRKMEETRLQDGVVAMRQIDWLLNGDELDDVKESERALRLLDDLMAKNSQLLPACNIYFVRLIRAAIMRTEPNDSDRLLRYHVQAVDCMRRCYPPNHPSLAYHLMNVGVFYGQQHQRTEAIEYLKEAESMFEFTLGGGHYMTKMAHDELEKIRSSEADGSK